MQNKVIEIKHYKFQRDLHYNDRHLWLRKESDGSITIGLDDLGQKLAGRIMAIRLPIEGVVLENGKIFGTMESGKWVERLRSSITGVVKNVNPKLRSIPSLVNEDPYEDGWLIRVLPTADIDQELSQLVTGEALENWLKREIEEKERLVQK